ncbi:hypothetical protein QBC39DRAFT_21975 [Podospora conica]|nr:hypothetical protein QBC39DRAFT_21975 [Schizothecium conicum]
MSATSSVEPPTPTTDAQQQQQQQQALSGSDGPPRKRAPRARALTKEEAIEIRALRKYAKWTHEQIAAATPFTINQIQVACKNTPRHKKKPDRWSVNNPGAAAAQVGEGPSTGSPLAAAAADGEADDDAVMDEEAS